MPPMPAVVGEVTSRPLLVPFAFGLRGYFCVPCAGGFVFTWLKVPPGCFTPPVHPCPCEVGCDCTVVTLVLEASVSEARVWP